MGDRISGLVQVTSREPISQHNLLKTIQQRAHKILEFRCMPLVPSVRRNWDRDEILKLEGTTISWPPHEWKKNEFRPTKTNVGIRSYNHRAENHVLQCINRTDYLALPGTSEDGKHSDNKVRSKERYYNYEFLRIVANRKTTSREDKEFVEMIVRAASVRNKSVDFLLCPFA